MKKILLLFSFYCFHQVVFAQFNLDTVTYQGSSENRINIVILGDGYLSSQQLKFKTDATNLSAALFNNSPFEEYQNHFNVFMIFVASNEEGAATDPANLIDNYYGSTFNYAGIERLLVPTRNDRALNVLASTFPSYDQALMVVNSPVYGGSGGWLATSSVNTAAAEVMVHEIGHSFAGLADEYWAGPQYAAELPNMTQESNPSVIRWKNWLNNFGIGIIPFTESTNWYRPHNTCKMRSLNNPFCAVCKEQILRTIQDLTSPIDQYSHNVGTETIFFDLVLLAPNPSHLNIKWYLNDVKIDQNVSSKTIRLQDLQSGANTVEAAIYDSSLLDRRNTVSLTSFRWTIEGSILSQITISEIPRPTYVVTGINSEVSRFSFKVFPNPVHQLLTVTCESTISSPSELNIFNSSGQLVYQAGTNSYDALHNYEINMMKYGRGLYTLIFRSGSFSHSERIIVN